MAEDNLSPNEKLSPHERFQNLEILRKAAWESVASRREFEWRISLAFWSLLAAFIAGVATTKLGVAGHCAKYALSIIPIVLAYAHTRWLNGIERAHDLDRIEEGDFREEMRRVINYPEKSKVTDLRDVIMHSKGWNKGAQLAATYALTMLAVISIWALLPAYGSCGQHGNCSQDCTRALPVDSR